MVGAWQTFYTLAGGAAASLAGLIFVAVTLHERSVMGNPLNRDRVWSSVALLVSVLVISLAACLPSQSERFLGLEIAPFAIYWAYRTGWVVRVLGVAMRRIERAPREYWQLEWAWWLSWTFALIGGTIALIAERDLGLPLLALAVVGMFGFATWNAWVLVSEVSE